MNTRRLAFALALASPLLAAIAPTRPASAALVGAGAIEINPKVSFSHSNLKREGYGNVDNFTDLELAPTIGYCLNDRFEVTSGVEIRHQSDNGTSATALGVLAGLTYNFRPQGSIVPFVGLGFGTLFTSGFTFDNTAVLAPALSGGMRVLVGDAASVNMSLGYEHETDGHVSTNRITAGVGVSLFPWHAGSAPPPATVSGRTRSR